MAVTDDARVQLSRCTAAGNRGTDVWAQKGDVVRFLDCTVADSSKAFGSGVFAQDTRVEAHHSSFCNNHVGGVVAAELVSVHLEACSLGDTSRAIH